MTPRLNPYPTCAQKANKASSDGLPPRVLVRRSSSSGSTPSQEPRPLRVAPDEDGAACCSGERALTAADVLVAEGLCLLCYH